MNSLPTKFEREAAEFKKKTIAATCTGLGAAGALLIWEAIMPIPYITLCLITGGICFYFIKAMLCFAVYRRALRLKNRYSTWPPLFTL